MLKIIQTKRQPDKFAEQCAKHKYESNVIKWVTTNISSQTGVCLGIHQKTTMTCGNLEEGIQFAFIKQITGE